MTEFTFNWQLQRGVSDHKINAEWSLKCLYSKSGSLIPKIVKICRNSTGAEIIVSGTFQLMNNSHCLLKRKFLQLIEYHSATTQVELNDDNGIYLMGNLYYGMPFSMTGTLKFISGMQLSENTKGVEFESLLNLSNDFECLLGAKSTYFSDMHLQCGTESFPAHKAILTARSSVFAVMFSTQMKEKQLNKVDITDIRPSVLKKMLSYIYTGKTGQLTPQSAGELLFAADKYQLQDLKRVCSDYLKSCVSTQNVLGTLVLGYLHDQGLKDFVMDFICNSCEEFDVLEKSVEWVTLREKRPSLAMDVLTRLVKSKDNKLKGRK